MVRTKEEARIAQNAYNAAYRKRKAAKSTPAELEASRAAARQRAANSSAAKRAVAANSNNAPTSSSQQGATLASGNVVFSDPSGIGSRLPQSVMDALLLKAQDDIFTQATVSTHLLRWPIGACP